jgi:hypothetical protein
MNAIQKIKLEYEQLIAKGFDANQRRFGVEQLPKCLSTMHQKNWLLSIQRRNFNTNKK